MVGKRRPRALQPRRDAWCLTTRDMRWFRFIHLLAFAVIVLVVARPTRARAEDGGVVLDAYEVAASSDCADETGFLEHVTRRVRRSAAQAERLRVEVHVEKRSSKELVGTILVTDAHGRR